MATFVTCDENRTVKFNILNAFWFNHILQEALYPGGSGVYPGNTMHKAGIHLGKRHQAITGHRVRGHTHTHTLIHNLRLANPPTGMLLDSERKPETPEETHTDTVPPLCLFIGVYFVQTLSLGYSKAWINCK